jgi:hypothetical protein
VLAFKIRTRLDSRCGLLLRTSVSTTLSAWAHNVTGLVVNNLDAEVGSTYAQFSKEQSHNTEHPQPTAFVA